MPIERDYRGRPVVICMVRYQSQYDYPGCPYNTGRPYPPWLRKATKKEDKTAVIEV